MDDICRFQLHLAESGMEIPYRNRIVTGVKFLFRVTLRRHALGTPIPSVPMDAEKMKQVVINLVRNAIEAMPKGGDVVVEDGVVDGRACLTVRDNGPGLPDGLDVFQLFVTPKPRGTGLGLSIAQQIVTEHGGEISVSTEPGAGASFVVCLPIPTVAGPSQKESPHEH